MARRRRVASRRGAHTTSAYALGPAFNHRSISSRSKPMAREFGPPKPDGRGKVSGTYARRHNEISLVAAPAPKREKPMAGANPQSRRKPLPQRESPPVLTLTRLHSEGQRSLFRSLPPPCIRGTMPRNQSLPTLAILLPSYSSEDWLPIRRRRVKLPTATPCRRVEPRRLPPEMLRSSLSLLSSLEGAATIRIQGTMIGLATSKGQRESESNDEPSAVDTHRRKSMRRHLRWPPKESSTTKPG